MMAVVTTGNGGYEKLDYRQVPVPSLNKDEVLIQVLAAGINNTEINTRLGWYSASVKGSTKDATTKQNQGAEDKADGGWNKATPFPLIQGTDCCGRVVKTESKNHQALINSRVLVRACMRTNGFESVETKWMASDFDGAFAQFVKVPASEVFVVDSDWKDAELASIPCAYGTSENMLQRAAVCNKDHVLVTGASGGVGSATVQLARRRGAKVIAITSKSKINQIKELGADQILTREDDLLSLLGENSVDVVIDNVAGPDFPGMLKVLRPGGRYATSGAIAGPLVELDMRNLYLKDISLIGCTAWDEPVFPNLVSYIEKNQIRPLVAKTFALENIVDAQINFLEKNHVGKFVLIPPALNALL